MADRSVTVRLRAVITEYQAAMRKASADTTAMTKNVSGSMAKLNREVGALGTELTRKVTVPLVGIGVGALKLAGDFETAFAQMVGLAGVAGEEVDGLRESLLDLAGETGVGPQKLAAALYEASSSGLDTVQALAAVQLAAKASAAGMGDTADIVGLIAGVTAAYGDEAISAAEATDILTAAVKTGSANPRELANSLGVVLPIAAQLGVSFDEVGGATAYLSNVFRDTSRTTNSLRAMFANLLAPSDQGRKTLEQFTGSADSLKEAIDRRGLLGALEVLRTSGISRSDEAMRSLFSDVDGYTAAVTLLNDESGTLTATLQTLGNSGGFLQAAFDEMDATKAQEMRKAFAELQVALIRLGATIAPIAASFARGFQEVAERFEALPGWVQAGIVAFLAFAAAAGPVVRTVSAIATILHTLAPIASKAFNAMAIGAYNAAGGITAAHVAAAAATLLIAGLTLAVLDNERAAAAARRRQHELADAIRETGSVAGGVAGLLSQAVQNNQFVSAAFAKTGVTIGDVAQALQQGGDAWQRMSARLLEGGRAAGLSEYEMRGLGALLAQLPTDAARAQTHLENMTKTGVEPAGDAAADAAAGINTLSSSVAGLGNIASMTDTELQALLDTVNSVYVGAFAAGDAQQAFRDAVASGATEMRSSGGAARDYAAEQRSLERATKDVTNAQEELAEAEAALAAARRGPSDREKQDAALDVKDAQLGLEQAKQGVKDAQKRLLEERKKGRGGDVAGAQLDLRSAQLRLERATLRVKDAQADQNKVMTSGAETSEKVRDAVDDVEQAQERLTEATERQLEAERTLRGEGATGGPVADRNRQIRSTIDQVVTSGQSWITTLANMKVPTDVIIGALDEQSAAAQILIDTLGDPDGKLQKFIDKNNELKRIFSDDAYRRAVRELAHNFGVIVNPGGGNQIIDLGTPQAGGGFAARAAGGPVRAGGTYWVGEKGRELVSFGDDAYVHDHQSSMRMLTDAGMMRSPALTAAPWSGALTAAPAAAPAVVNEMTIELHTNTDIVNLVGALARHSKHDALPFHIKKHIR